jgi:hypothetical protein
MPEPETRLWSREDFAARLHEVFRVGPDGELELELVEITDRSNARLEQFSVFFKGPQWPRLSQGIHALVHPEAGRLELFLVPLGPRDGGQSYEAVFSRFVVTPGATNIEATV